MVSIDILVSIGFFRLFVNAFRRFFLSASDLRMSAKYVFFRSVAVFDDLFIMFLMISSLWGRRLLWGDGKNPVSTAFQRRYRTYIKYVPTVATGLRPNIGCGSEKQTKTSCFVWLFSHLSLYLRYQRGERLAKGKKAATAGLL